jgi:hypothetical protein
MTKTTPTTDVVDDNDNHLCHSDAGPAAEDETMKRMTSARPTDKSGQGPKRTRAIAVAHPLKI